MMRKLGRMVGKARAMAGEFRHAFDDLARQAELDELRKEIEAIKRDNILKQASADLRAAEADINAAVMTRSPASASPEPELPFENAPGTAEAKP
jgi:sec-independent protein translocase protein TatB